MTIDTNSSEGILYLEDGSVFQGKGFGFKGTRIGELVFNTSMTGYQELMTNPSCHGQIITMTYPIIGSCGISEGGYESDEVHSFGLVIRDLCRQPSNEKSIDDLDSWLKDHEVPGIYDVDTRQITKKLRNVGTMKALISTEEISIGEARSLCESSSLRSDWMKETAVSTKTVILPGGSGEGSDADSPGGAGEGSDAGAPGGAEGAGSTGDDGSIYDIAIMDFGVRRSVIRCLCGKNCRLTLYPYGTKAEDIIGDDPDGILLTNGPGDPAEATEAVEETEKLIHLSDIPMFGIGLGHQILAMALGGSTYKMKYGHRGGNHGIYDKNNKRSYIASQYHGHAVSNDSIILKGMEVTHLNLNDGSVEGMEHRDYSIFSVQFIPDTDGDGDSAYLFDRFLAMSQEYSTEKSSREDADPMST